MTMATGILAREGWFPAVRFYNGERSSREPTYEDGMILVTQL